MMVVFLNEMLIPDIVRILVYFFNKNFGRYFDNFQSLFVNLKIKRASQKKQSMNLTLISGYNYFPATKISLGSVNATLKQGIFSHGFGVRSVICYQLF